MARGVPVIAYASGGVKETVTWERGISYGELDVESVKSAIVSYESLSDEEKEMKKQASLLFAASCSEEVFIDKMTSAVRGI